MQALRQTGWMVARQLRNLSRQPIWVVMMVGVTHELPWW